MNKDLKVLLVGCMLAFVLCPMLGSAYAQNNPCLIPPGNYRTQTQGGWGADCHGGNAGCIRDGHFAPVFPSGLTVGGTFTIHFTSAAAINTFLPATTTPGVLTANLTDPASSPAGEFAGQVVSLALSLGFSNASVPTFNPNLGSLVIQYGVHSPLGPFSGWTVNQVFALANQVLGGNTGALPAGISLSDLNGVITSINECFDDGNTSTHYLVLPDCILPVEVASFDAIAGSDAIVVQWRTASENSVDYYQLSRSENGSDWLTLAAVSSQGNGATGFTYRYTDAIVVRGVTYRYQLTVHDVNGSAITYSHTASATLGGSGSVTDYALLQNYPNPFNPTTTISYTLREAGHVTLTVFDLTGRVVALLENGERTAGSHSVGFDGRALSSGVYFYRLEAGSFDAVRKLVLMK